MNNITIIRGENLWLEEEAIRQLKNIALLEGVIKTVGLPDLHPSKQMPIGAVWQTKNIIYPFLIGNDIGCSMTLFDTHIPLRKYKQEQWVKRLVGHPNSDDVLPLDETPHSPIKTLGSIGGGNHFAEFQQIDKIFDPKTADAFLLNKSNTYLLIHSGSRNYGEQIYRNFCNQNGYLADSHKGIKYLELHNDAMKWAATNRNIVAEKLIHMLGFKDGKELVTDCPHNFLEEKNGSWLHRKGAASAENGIIPIAGSRGSVTYLVKPYPKEDSLFSISHGAGRKWERGQCKGRLENKYKRNQLYYTSLKSAVVTNDIANLYEEAPEAYKNIEHIIDSLYKAGLINIVATMKPLITYKGV